MEQHDKDVTSAPLTEESPTGEEQHASPSVEDKAAFDYQQLLPQFKAATKDVPRKQLLKVITSLMEYPLESNSLHFSYPAEQKLFYIGMQIMDCKAILMNAVMKLTQDKEAFQKFQSELAALTAAKSNQDDKELETNDL